MAKKTNDIDNNNNPADGAVDYKGKGKGSNPNSLKNLKRKEKAEEPKEKKYMQIDVADYAEYLRYMAKLRNKPITKYVVELIKADYEQNKELYEALKKDNYIEK